MILGIGIDLLNTNRVEKLLEKFKDNFPKKMLSAEESEKYKNSKNKMNFLAKKFCGKEAFSKALGTGMGRGINFSDITITNDILGKPIIILSNKASIFVEKIFKKDFNDIKIDISLSDEMPYINAFVVISNIY